MSTILNTTQQYNAADVVTHTNLNQIVGGTTFVAGNGGATDNTSLEVDTTSGSLQIKDNGVTTAKLLDSTDKTDGVTLPKIQHIDTAKVLGRTSTGEGNVEEVTLNTDDEMASSSATTLATDGSIKAYVDTGDATQIGVDQTWQPVTRALDGTSYTNDTGKPIMVKGRFNGNTDDHTIKIFVTPSGGSEIEIVFAIGTNSGGGVASNGSIIIPNNTAYKFSKSGDALTFFQFHELR